MEQASIAVGLDIGTTKIVAMVGRGERVWKDGDFRDW